MNPSVKPHKNTYKENLKTVYLDLKTKNMEKIQPEGKRHITFKRIIRLTDGFLKEKVEL